MLNGDMGWDLMSGFLILTPIIGIIKDVAIIAALVKLIQALNTYINKNSF